MTTITFDTSESLAQELHYFAEAKHKSLNVLLTEMLQNYLSSEEDAADLALVKARENEPCSSLEDVIMRLKADGKTKMTTTKNLYTDIRAHVESN